VPVPSDVTRFFPVPGSIRPASHRLRPATTTSTVRSRLVLVQKISCSGVRRRRPPAAATCFTSLEPPERTYA
jgi:hypothetical protein